MGSPEIIEIGTGNKLFNNMLVYSAGFGEITTTKENSGKRCFEVFKCFGESAPINIVSMIIMVALDADELGLKHVGCHANINLPDTREGCLTVEEISQDPPDSLELPGDVHVSFQQETIIIGAQSLLNTEETFPSDLWEGFLTTCFGYMVYASEYSSPGTAPLSRNPKLYIVGQRS